MSAAVDSSQRTYVLSVRDGQGTTVEEVRTGRKVRLATLTEAIDQIERWLAEGRSVTGPGEPGP